MVSFNEFVTTPWTVKDVSSATEQTGTRRKRATTAHDLKNFIGFVFILGT
jgi:hypothetical protein